MHVESKVGASDLEAISLGLLCTWGTRFFQALAGAVMFSTYAFLIDDLFGWTDMHFGGIMASLGLMYAILQSIVFPLFGRHGKAGTALALAVASICGAAGGLILPLAGIITHFAGLALLTFAGAMFAPAVPVLVGIFAGRRHLGFGNGVAQACEKAAGIIGPSVGGFLYEENKWIMFSFGVSCYLVCAVGAGGVSLSHEAEECEGEDKPLIHKTG